MSETEIKIEKYVSKPQTVDVVQFTGKNGKAVAEYLKEQVIPQCTVRNGGSYVRLSFDYGDHGSDVTIRKGEYLIALKDGHIAILSKDELEEVYKKKGK